MSCLVFCSCDFQSSLGEEGASLGAFRAFVWFVLVCFCLFPLPLGVWEGLRCVIVALPGLFSYYISTATKWINEEKLQQKYQLWTVNYNTVGDSCVLSLLVSHKIFIQCFGTAVLCDCGHSWVSSFLCLIDVQHLLFIMKTRLYNFDLLKPRFYIVKLGFTRVYIIFLILLKNIDCGYSPRRF